jgi:hypothetical protein
MDADEKRRLYDPILDRPWVHQNTDYNGNAGIVTSEGMYVCSVPHEVAHRIVEDHNSALGRQRCKRCGSRLDPDGTCPLAWEEAQ